MKKHILFLIAILYSIQLISAKATAPIPIDRWIEIDLYWFDHADMKKSAELFWERYHPLFVGINGWKGVVLNVGWFGDYITLWNGDLKQDIKFPQNMRTDPQFKTEGLLEGTSLDRIEQWNRRFKETGEHRFINVKPWSYADLQKLVQLLRDIPREKYQINNVRIGSFVIGWQRGRAGSSKSEFGAMHPESILTDFKNGRELNFLAKLHKDSVQYGAFPNGLPEGTPFTDFFGKQWGNMSAKIGLDTIVLRDSFLGVGIYKREGPFGKVPPNNTEKVAEWSKATGNLVKQTKLANSNALVIAYSSAASAVADWRVNCFDLEAIAKEGFLDAWIDQTWAGSWNEVGQRSSGFWNIQTLGWTYQLGYMLVHAAVLADTKVHHYFLTETFDARESWDIIHNARERLRWGIWAYSHATVKTPNGLKMPAGSYISWANQSERLLSEEDVRFLTDVSNDAFLDAHNTTKIFGPTLVYCRSAMEWQMQNKPAEFIKEWIDEQAGSLMKWSVPILSITRSEYLPSIESDMFLFQTPVHLNPKEKENIMKVIGSSKPVGVFASPAGGLDADIAKMMGVSTKDTNSMKSLRCIGTLDFQTEGIYQLLPNTFPLFQLFTQNKFTRGLEPVYSVSGSPCLGYKYTGMKQLVFWDPPELANNLLESPGGYERSLDQILGSPTPYVLTARLVNEVLKNSGNFHGSEISQYAPVNLAMWQLKDGCYRVMAANLEEGINHTADNSSFAAANLPQLSGRDQLITILEKWSGHKIVLEGQKLPIRLEHGQTKLFMIK